MRHPSLVSGLATLAVLAGTACSDGPAAPRQNEPGAEGARWATWVLPEGQALRPPPPPAANSEQTQREREEIVRLQRTPGLDEEIRRWDGPPTLAWSNRAVDLLEFYWPLLPDVRLATPVRAARIMALLHVAQHDALVAAWDAKYAYERPAPFRVDTRIRAHVAAGNVPSYPSEHAVAAAAAATVLAYAFPGEDSSEFHALAQRAGESRIAAGVAYPSDVDAGLALGRAVADRVLARARQDGASQAWAGTVPIGEGMWRATPPRRVAVPFDVLAGNWKTWVIPRGDTFRPPPPPALASPEFVRDLQELRALGTTRTREQADIARYWATDAPSLRWELFLIEEIQRRKLGPLHAARAQALSSIAIYDAFVACWDAKFTYWVARPITVDPAIATVFATPPFPSYPSGHSTISAAAAEVFGYLFPDAAATYRNKAHEASLSRVWAGVHFRFDVLAGEELGEQIGKAVVAHARGIR